MSAARGSRRLRQKIRPFLEAVSDEGYVVTSIGHGGRHPRLTIQIGDQKVVKVCPGSPGDRRSLQNWRAELRRLGR